MTNPQPLPDVSEIAGKLLLARRPKGTKVERWGILNPYGDLWTHETFESADQARRYVHRFWQGLNGAGGDLRRFRPIRVKVHVTASTKRQLDGRYSVETPAHLEQSR